MRIVFCWSGISGYMAACWHELASRPGIALHVLAHRSDGSTAFSESLLAGLSHQFLDRTTAKDERAVERLVTEQRPDIVVMTGWWLRPYRRLVSARSLEDCRFVMGVDSPWRLELQYLTQLRYRSTLRRVDHFMVAGERSWQYVRRLGIPSDRISRGMYGVDAARWALAADRRHKGPWPRTFMFLGRYDMVKGIDVLAEGFRLYRQERPNGWDLVCCGTGPERHRLEAIEGIADRGFVQPEDMTGVMAGAGAMVLPSRFDPWPLAIVEAASAGLPIVCSDACGSAVEVVRPYYNGLIFASESAKGLARAMAEIEDREAAMPRWGERSIALAAPYATPVWADRWMSVFASLANRNA